MKKIVFILLILPSIFICCKKEKVTKSNFDYIIAHQWMYNRLYSGYSDANHLGTISYQRGGQNNTINLDFDKANFYADGTIDEVVDQAGSNHVPGTWKFTTRDQVHIIVQNSTGTYNTTIVLADDNHFNWFYTDQGGITRYGEYIPAK